MDLWQADTVLGNLPTKRLKSKIGHGDCWAVKEFITVSSLCGSLVASQLLTNLLTKTIAIRKLSEETGWQHRESLASPCGSLIASLERAAASGSSLNCVELVCAFAI